ncbi:MAG: hypothetical protein ACM3N9_01785 [Syntrophothermus sp.]
MEEKHSIQSTVFRAIKDVLPAHLSLVHEVSELLKISYDSAYRRMRGEKELTIDELALICRHFSISADAVLNLPSDKIIFSSRAIGQDGFSLKQWLVSILEDIRVLHESQEKEIIYAAKDLPIFCFFEFPELAAFKFYFWQKSLLPSAQPPEKLFSFEVDEEFLNLGKKALFIYNQIPSTELWNEGTILSILKQIEYCCISGFFQKKEDAIRLCEIIEQYIEHVRTQAELGFRFLYGQDQKGVPGSFKLFHNEVLLTDNTIFVLAGGKKKTYHTYNIINLLISTDQGFCEQIYNSLNTLMQKSTLISGTGAKERNSFFNHLTEMIRVLKGKFV